MTLLEAFKSQIEFGYTNDNLFEKILIDRDLTSGTTYAKTYRQSIDMCIIDVAQILMSHPDVKDGSQSLSFDKAALKSQVLTLASRYDLSTTTLLGLGLGNDVSGEAIW